MTPEGLPATDSRVPSAPARGQRAWQSQGRGGEYPVFYIPDSQKQNLLRCAAATSSSEAASDIQVGHEGVVALLEGVIQLAFTKSGFDLIVEPLEGS